MSQQETCHKNLNKMVITIKFTCHITIIYKHKIWYQEDTTLSKFRLIVSGLSPNKGVFKPRRFEIASRRLRYSRKPATNTSKVRKEL